MQTTHAGECRCAMSARGHARRATGAPPIRAEHRSASTDLGVAPDMGRKSKLRVLLELGQTESNTEGNGGSAKGRLVEVVGAGIDRVRECLDEYLSTLHASLSCGSYKCRYRRTKN
ncbi:MAG: hypothetical protein QM784_13835 [Polyangiaceae bacterium]